MQWDAGLPTCTGAHNDRRLQGAWERQGPTVYSLRMRLAPVAINICRFSSLHPRATLHRKLQQLNGLSMAKSIHVVASLRRNP